jgi:hypothetical protein
VKIVHVVGVFVLVSLSGCSLLCLFYRDISISFCTASKEGSGHDVSEVLPRRLPCADFRKPHKVLVVTADIPTEIRKGHRTNTVTHCYCDANMLGIKF